VHCTVSIGLSVSVPKEPIKSLINRTDKALYKAKNLGRNQVQVASI
jgi:PleD family two-component response regulator